MDREMCMRRIVGLMICGGLLGSSTVTSADETLLNSSGNPIRVQRAVAALSLKTCEEQGKAHGNASERFQGRIDAKCFDHFLSSAPLNAVKQTPDGGVLAFGNRNILYLRFSPKGADSDPSLRALVADRIIAGGNTRLKDIRSVAIDAENKEIFVLDGGKGEILVFEFNQSGDVKPRRVLESPELLGATAIAIAAKAQALIVTLPERGEVRIFARKAATLPADPAFPPSAHRVLKGGKGGFAAPHSVAVDEEAGELYVVDRDGNQILAFDLAGIGDSEPKRVIRGHGTELDHPVAISFSKTRGEIEIFNEDGRALRHARLSSGDKGPLTDPKSPLR